MGARNGAAYLERLHDDRDVWIDGERVTDVTRDARLGRGVHSIAALYDLQLDPRRIDQMTYVSPTSGDRVGLSHIEPRSIDDLVRRRTMVRGLVRVERRHARPQPGLPEHDGHGLRRQRRLLRPQRPSLWSEHPALLRAGARAGPVPDSHAGRAAGQSRRAPGLAGRRRRRAPRRQRDRCRTAAVGRAHPGDAGSRLGRPVRGALAVALHRRRGQPACFRVLDPGAPRPGCA